MIVVAAVVIIVELFGCSWFAALSQTITDFIISL